jgi:hypothetical protein
MEELHQRFHRAARGPSGDAQVGIADEPRVLEAQDVGTGLPHLVRGAELITPLGILDGGPPGHLKGRTEPDNFVLDGEAVQLPGNPRVRVVPDDEAQIGAHDVEQTGQPRPKGVLGAGPVHDEVEILHRRLPCGRLVLVPLSCAERIVDGYARLELARLVGLIAQPQSTAEVPLQREPFAGGDDLE